MYDDHVYYVHNYSKYSIDGAKCEVVVCTSNSSYVVTDRGKVCKQVYIL